MGTQHRLFCVKKGFKKCSFLLGRFSFFRAQCVDMSQNNQQFIPNSFIDLFKDPLRPYAKASEPFEVILERYDLCEDMAQMLYQPALNMMGSMNITESDVIERTFKGLLVNQEIVKTQEAQWIVQRLCELLEWQIKELPLFLTTLREEFLLETKKEI